MQITKIDAKRLMRARAAFTTRRVPRDSMVTLSDLKVEPRAGDVVLARVTKLGQHKHLQLTDGRRARMHLGDEILVVYGNRYAPDQFEGVVPSGLGACHLVAGGGIAAMMLSKSSGMKSPTCLEPLGLVGDSHGRTINLDQHRLPSLPALRPQPAVIAVAGTAMNAGKTETLCQLVKGLSRAGLRVAVGKVTGTGAGGDIWAVSDAGAETVLDFTDVGLVSTYMVSAERVEEAAISILGHLTEKCPDVICLEVADGLLQTETAQLLGSQRFVGMLDGVLFAAGDAMGGVAGGQRLIDLGVPVLGITGKLTSSPLAMREVGQFSDLPVIPTFALSDPHLALSLVQAYIETKQVSTAK